MGFPINLNEARKTLEACLTPELRMKYFDLLRQWFSFKGQISRDHFDSEVRKLLITEEQIKNHNYFLLAILSKPFGNKIKSNRNTSDKGGFECAEYSDYVQPLTATMLPAEEYENRSAAAELFMPDSGFIATRIAITSWENGLDGAEDSVTEVITNATQVFVKNILMAMISRLKSYKIRDGKFQYGFNLPVPDPFLRNYNNVIDETQESKVEVVDGEDTFIPRSKPSLENIEQQAAFEYSCAKKRKSENTLTVRLLYETLRENPSILGSHEMHSVNLFKLGLQMD